ncbi:vasculin-like [Lineus longissimus]|uniref:vasculin-like n=1 Tax=Lineus longissimus TaxID=88925 RepID=UPI002B4E3EFA
MASSKAPNHDFAPAWLKIPPNDNRPSGGNHSERWQHSRKDDSHGSYNKYVQDYVYGPLPRQRSFESYDDGHRPPGPTKQRHHSIDDDYYNQMAYAGYYNGYYNNENYGSHYRSQPMLYRPGPREGKYQHPHSRYGQQVNGGFSPNYYDYQYDFYGDYYNPYNERTDKQTNGKQRDPRKERRQSGDLSKPKLDQDDDFPSLNGDVIEGEKSGQQGTVSGNSAWENPPKVQNNMSDSRQSSPDIQSREETNDKNSSSMYKAVVSKATLSKKIQNRDSPKMNGQVQRDKKTEILQNMRKRGSPDINSNDKAHHENGDGKEDLRSSMETLKIDESGTDLLSSSLEAEQRLLREMGWKDEDDEEYVITEDDMKEFKNLSEQMKQNGVAKPTLPKSWSPKHLNSYDILHAEAELNDTLSSDSESDID